MIRRNHVGISIVVERWLVALETVGRRCPSSDGLRSVQAVLLGRKANDTISFNWRSLSEADLSEASAIVAANY